VLAVFNESGNCFNGVDDDCDGALDCADSDCSKDTQCICQSHTEDCQNVWMTIAIASGLRGPRLSVAHSLCLRTSGHSEICNNGVDDDCDLLVDCADPNWFASASCKQLAG